ncbi:hypothetical protein CL634_03390 [bacterium]|nr:hypothetical protein [bacterium]|tara:strand:- start:767 stop:1267 length:501 start_codon:yes stop_codon:yes gene_type:complete
MKVIDIAEDLYRELGDPTDISIPAIVYWLKTNVGSLTNLIGIKYTVDSTSQEIVDEESKEIVAEVGAVLKKMYVIHHYELKLRANITGLLKDTIISVTDDNSSVIKVNKNEVSKVLAQIKNQEYAELQKMVTAFRRREAKPIQVAGDDTVVDNRLSKYNSFNRINN